MKAGQGRVSGASEPLTGCNDPTLGKEHPDSSLAALRRNSVRVSGPCPDQDVLECPRRVGGTPKHILSRAFCHRHKVAVIQNISCPFLGISEVKPVYTPLALRDWFRAAPRNPQRSKPKAPGRWLRSLRDHNHLLVACWAF